MNSGFFSLYFNFRFSIGRFVWPTLVGVRVDIRVICQR